MIKMKAYSLFFAVIVLLTACKKDGSTDTNPLYKRWRLVGSSYSIGGPQIYAPATEKGKFVQFYPDGKVIETAFGGDYQTFTKDSTYITLIKPNTSFKYFYHIKNDTLSMGYIGCIEGCSTIFVKY